MCWEFGLITMGVVIAYSVYVYINAWGINGYLKNIVGVLLNYLSPPYIAFQPQKLCLVFDSEDNRMSSPTMVCRDDNAFFMSIELLY